MATTLLPGIYDASLADSQIDVCTEDAQAITLRLAREEGLFVRRQFRCQCTGGPAIGRQSSRRLRHCNYSLRQRFPLSQRRSLEWGIDMISLLPLHLDAISRQAEAEYPFECCGLLIGTLIAGKRKSIAHILPISNARDAAKQAQPVPDYAAGTLAGRVIRPKKHHGCSGLLSFSS